MPDLSPDAARAWFVDHVPGLDHLADRLVTPIERDPAVAKSLVELGAALEQALGREGGVVALGREPAALLLRQILEQLGPMRLVRILSWLVETPDGRSIAVQMLGSGDDPSELRATLHELNKQAVLSRIFAPERIDTLLRACKTAFGELA